MLVRARQLIEEGGLAAVLLSREGKGQLSTFGQWCFVGLVVVDAFLAEAGVGIVVVQGRVVEFVRIKFVDVFLICARLHPNQLGVVLAQGEGIAVDEHFHRVAQGGVFH